MGLPTELARRLGRTLPRKTLVDFARRAVAERELALCLHRVHRGSRRTGEKLPEMSIEWTALDELLDALAPLRPTVSFDDGYRDSAEYLREAAVRHPTSRFLFFVCPERLVRRHAFEWDVEEAGGVEVADDPRYALATVEECLALAALPNVTLGNHTNLHARMSELSPLELRDELAKSQEDFERLFGPMRHFAFPFGTPHVDFGEEAVRCLRSSSSALLWSTEPRPFSSDERETRAVLPRFAIDGTWSVGEMLAWIGVRALVSRVNQAPGFQREALIDVAA